MRGGKLCLAEVSNKDFDVAIILCVGALTH